jgi:Mg-chelatase subunit ChlI
MNPEEGDLRPQLLDRFALSVDIRGIRDARERVQIMERNIAFEGDAQGFRERWLPHEKQLSDQIEEARKLLRKVNYTKRDLLSIAALSASLNVDGHRSDLVILKAAIAHAAFEKRTALTDLDIAIAAELAFPHRIKRGPFNQQDIGFTELQERIEQLQGASMESDETQPAPEDSEAEEKKKPVR